MWGPGAIVHIINILPFAGVLGYTLNFKRYEVARDEGNSSPNYVYILFEAAALTLTFVKENRDAFVAVEDQLTPALNQII